MYQKRETKLYWDTSKSSSEQPNRLAEEGPVKLQFQDHFLECEGSMVLLYWENDRSTARIGTIIKVNDDETNTIVFRPYGWQEKSKKNITLPGKIYL